MQGNASEETTRRRGVKENTKRDELLQGCVSPCRAEPAGGSILPKVYSSLCGVSPKHFRWYCFFFSSMFANSHVFCSSLYSLTLICSLSEDIKDSEYLDLEFVWPDSVWGFKPTWVDQEPTSSTVDWYACSLSTISIYRIPAQQPHVYIHTENNK